MKREATKDYERGEHARCRTCDRPVGEKALAERGRLGEPLVFCDERCREDYFQRVDMLLDGDEDVGAA
ncbi:MAG TPA: hypothetical protein VFF73_31365 [Planctomycetota bacterium]|nr:hypothetical protein [Planctomycetota bacterium]